MEDIGKARLKDPIYPPSDAIATICYTSGTTGNPKGVVLTHGCLANAVWSQMHGLNFDDMPVSYAFLPLAHCYGVRALIMSEWHLNLRLDSSQRMCELTVIARGGSLGHWSGDPLLIVEDMQILKPNMFPSVPRVLNRIYQAAMAAAELPGVKGALFRYALETKLQNLKTTGSFTHAVWDRIVFRKASPSLAHLWERI